MRTISVPARECWRPVVGFETTYEVSTLGRLRRIAPAIGSYVGRILQGSRNRDGYLRVQLARSPLPPVYRLIHILVLVAFVGPRPDGCEACHKDGDPANAALSNLRWDTPLANAKDKIGHGTVSRGTHHGMVKLTEAQVRRIRTAPGSQQTIAAQFGISQTHVSDIKCALKWAHLA
jgi:hypothetical protein